jgi:hypothetical protein
VLQDPTKEGAAAGTCRASAPAATQQATQKIAAATAAATACSERLCRKIYLAILHKQTVLQCSQVFCRPHIESHGCVPTLHFTVYTAACTCTPRGGSTIARGPYSKNISALKLKCTSKVEIVSLCPLIHVLNFVSDTQSEPKNGSKPTRETTLFQKRSHSRDSSAKWVFEILNSHAMLTIVITRHT